MARRKQESVDNYSILDSMISHLVWFLKVLVIWISINSVYFLVLILIAGQGEVVYGLVLSLILPMLWCKLRRYRIRDKTKLSYISLVIIFSTVLQILINRGVLAYLWSRLAVIGG